MTPDVKMTRPVRSLCEGSSHCLSQQRCQVIHRWLSLDLQLGKVITVRLCDDHTEVVRAALTHRLRQRTKVGFPGFVFLGQAFEAALHEEGRTLAQPQL